jgi:hypothetical protein
MLRRIASPRQADGRRRVANGIIALTTSNSASAGICERRASHIAIQTIRSARDKLVKGSYLLGIAPWAAANEAFVSGGCSSGSGAQHCAGSELGDGK